MEIGYEICVDFRLIGLATEMAKGLIEHVWKFPEVQLVTAHTLATDNPSTQVLKKAGFSFASEVPSGELDTIWRWELHRPA